MSKKTLIYLLLPLILISCASVDSHLQKNDPKAAQAFCDSKKGSERIACLEKVANYYLKKNNYVIPSKIYMGLGKETGQKTYHIKAADAYVSVIDPTKMFASQFAFIIMYYEKGGETEKALQYLKGYIATENFPTKHKSQRFVREYSLLLKYPEGVVAAAKIATSKGSYKDAESYYTEIGKKEMIPEMWKQIGLDRLKKRKYRKAAEAFNKAKQPLLEKEAYIAGAKRALSLKKPLYDYALENYKLAGDEPEGKRQVALLLISKKYYSRALEMAKTVSPQFYTDALVKVGDKSLDWSTSSAIPYFQKANLKNYQCRIGDYFLKQKKPDFKSAEDWYGKAADRSCQSRLLLKAIELDNINLISKYAGDTSDKKVLQKIAKTAIANNRPALAAMSYEKAGKSKEALNYWKVAYKSSIDRKRYYNDYKSTWKENSQEAQSLFWQMIQAEVSSQKTPNGTTVINAFKNDYPLLSLGYSLNHSIYRALTDSAFDTAMDNSTTSESTLTLGALNADKARVFLTFNNLLRTIAQNKQFFTNDKYEKGFSFLLSAQEHILRNNFSDYVSELDKAKGIFEK